MPYIRNIAGHPTEDRRRKLALSIATLSVDTGGGTGISGSTRQRFFVCVEMLLAAWIDRFARDQGKERYYNFNDENGVLIDAIWEMERRTGVSVWKFSDPAVYIQKDSVKRAECRENFTAFTQHLVAQFDNDRGEAVGELNFAVSEIALALVNTGKLTVSEAIRVIYAAGKYHYNMRAALYEDTSISDPDKGDTPGYARYRELHHDGFPPQNLNEQ